MRISDWSSDVCSSDLRTTHYVSVICRGELWARRTTTYRAITRRVSGIFTRYVPLWIKILAILPVIEDGSVLALCSLREKGMKWTMMAAAAISLAALPTPANADRKSGVSGKSVSVRVDLGGRRSQKKK